MAERWEALSIQIPGQDLLEGARQALEGLMIYLEITKSILETVKVFLVDFGNPIKPIVEAMLQLIVDLFESLKRSGLYAWFDVPNPLKDPNFNRFVGGFRAFVERFNSGLIDPKDPNRPQPVEGATQSGFMLIVADAEEPLALMRYMETLQRFFGKEFSAPQYQAPSNFKVLPMGRAGDPILAIARFFEYQPKSIVVEWSLPQVTSPGDPGFADLIQGASLNFVPPKFLIEKSEINPAVGEVTVEELGDPSRAGPVIITQYTRALMRGVQRVIPHSVRLHDEYGDPVYKFQKYIVIDASSETATFLLGQLGTFRYIDSDVEPNKVYFYRVRAFSGALAVSGDSVSFEAPQTNVIDKNTRLHWPASDRSDKPVMGKASPIARIMIPTFPEPRFDVIETLQRLFQTAFSLNFHLPLSKDAKFDSEGLAIEPTVTSEIGKGSLTNLAGPLTAFKAIPIIGEGLTKITDVTARFQRDPATGRLPEQPWNNSSVVRNSARLANIVAGAMLGANSALAFKSFMENGFPKEAPTEVEGLKATNLYELVYQITEVQDPEEADQEAVQEAGVLYSSAFSDPHVRLNVLAAVSFCKAFTLVGAQADWIQVSILRDIVPWSGQIIYELLEKMQALVDAYAGVMDELRAFIDLIVGKIDTLERLLQYLVSILDFVAGLSLGFYILNVPKTNGGVGEWMSLIDEAEGTPPPSGPGGYTGGVALAYVGTDVGPYAEALKLIF
jgi:hypothetical protein